MLRLLTTALVTTAMLVVAPVARVTARPLHRRRRAALSLASCGAYETLTLRNLVGAGPGPVRDIEHAVEAQSRQLRRWWHTPCVQFGAGGWPVTLAPGPVCGEFWGCHCPPAPTALDGCDPRAPTPEAFVGTAHERITSPDVSTTISHEVMEMLVDPGDTGHEVCDAVEDGSYILDGVLVSDFVTPDWFEPGSDGPWDEVHLARGAGVAY